MDTNKVRAAKRLVSKALKRLTELEAELVEERIEEKPEHYAGEPFVMENNKPVDWEYTGEKRTPKKGEVCEHGAGKIWGAIKVFNDWEDKPEFHRWILQPAGTHTKQQAEQKKDQPVTTVTVWTDKYYIFCEENHYNLLQDTPFYKWQYSFSGTPDIDHIIEETRLGKPDGALAVKVESDKIIGFKVYQAHNVMLWKEEVYPEYGGDI